MESLHTLDGHEKDTWMGIREGIWERNSDQGRVEHSAYDPDKDATPWRSFYSKYHLHLAIGQIHMVNAPTLSIGTDIRSAQW
ncbi:unnamed protein product [Penicillium camemberti]|uniref:Str. FM013 n=1 Tax=Penicillium camemberti (strain FM 013) TaxID=1429867 RepID=A0A0G4PR50_PENC3|nr:unnamed protein product [Penicillium camemberti]